jgi:hypothetical protein
LLEGLLQTRGVGSRQRKDINKAKANWLQSTSLKVLDVKLTTVTRKNVDPDYELFALVQSDNSLPNPRIP